MKIFLLSYVYFIDNNATIPFGKAFTTYEEANKHLNEMIAEHLKPKSGTDAYNIVLDESFPDLMFTFYRRFVALRSVDNSEIGIYYTLTDTEIAL